MKNEITVTAEVSELNKIETIDLLELGFTKDRWDLLDIEEQREIIQEYFDNLPDQPCWIVSNI